MRRVRGILLALLGAAIILTFSLTRAGSSEAASPSQLLPAREAQTVGPGVDNSVCLACHGQPGQTFTMPNGDVVDIYVNPDDYQASVHGRGGYACVQCHTNIREYPHPKLDADIESARALAIELNITCRQCHAMLFEKNAISVHAAARAEGQLAAAVCVDCHGAHNTRQLTDPDTHELLPESRIWIPQTCAKCHSAIYDKYRKSVHGAALIDENNQDVPTCIDCHGVHSILDPTTAAFRLRSPEICAKCHTDEEKMARYGISTYVLTSYVADFHGTTVVLFEKQSPYDETNKAVCYDCHGIHDIESNRDPQTGLRLQQNLLQRCQECHPDASINFPTAWLSHYEPSVDKYPMVYYVNLFYRFFIPGTLGSMGILVVLDVSKRIVNLRAKHAKAAPAHPASASAAENPTKSGKGQEEVKHE